MELKIINQDFSVCKVKDLSQIDYSDKFCFIGKTDEEFSLVCSTDLVPENKIGIFAVSTYNTDYILTKKENFNMAINVLENNGYEIK